MATPRVNPMLQRVAEKSITASPSPALTFQVVPWSPSPAPSSQRSRSTTPRGLPRLAWTPDMELALVEALVKEVTERGHRADSGYKKEAWEYARGEVQLVAGAARIVTVAHCKNKHDGFKKDWKVWVNLTSQFGLSVDDNGVVVGDPAAIKAYFQAHKNARKFQYRPIKYEALLCQLFEGVLATRQDAMTIEDIVQASVERDLSEDPTARGDRLAGDTTQKICFKLNP